MISETALAFHRLEGPTKGIAAAAALGSIYALNRSGTQNPDHLEKAVALTLDSRDDDLQTRTKAVVNKTCALLAGGVALYETYKYGQYIPPEVLALGGGAGLIFSLKKANRSYDHPQNET